MSEQPSELERSLGISTLAINTMNLTIGGGIFVVPAVVASGLGSAGFLAYLTCAGLMILVMLCYADIGSKITKPGGSFAYVEEMLGPYVGFLINALYWFGFSAVAIAAVVNAMADMISAYLPVFQDRPVRYLFFALLLALFAAIHIRGTKTGARFVVANTLIKLVPLALLVGVGFWQVKVENLIVTEWPSITTIGQISLVLFFAFSGSESSLGNSGEFRNPQRTIPRGILLGFLGVLFCYMSVQFVGQGVLGAVLGTSTDAPLAEVGRAIMGNTGYTLLMIGAILSIYGLISGDIMSTSRVIYAGSRAGLYPSVFGKLHPQFLSPANAILMYAGVIGALACLGNFKSLALISSSAVLLIYLAVVIATLRRKLEQRPEDKGTFDTPGGMVIPLLALAVVGWFLWHIPINELMALLAFFAVLSAIFFVYSRKRLNRSRTLPTTDENDEPPAHA